MHTPRPHGKFDEGQALSHADAAAMRRLALQATSLKQAGRLDNWRSHHILPSGRRAEVVDMGGVFKVRAYAKSEPIAPTTGSRPGEPGDIPMLFSGAVTRWHLDTKRGQKVRLALTDQCRRRLAQYRKDVAVPAEMELAKFTIGYPAHADHLAPSKTAGFYTQYHALYPGWYSGAMTQVVQCVLGWGRQGVPADESGPWDNVRMRLPAKVRRAIAAEMKDWMLPAYEGVPPSSGQVQYDFQFVRSHVVIFGDDGKPWLMRIASGSMWAMPLPLVAGTQTDAFRKYVVHCNDQELIELLDRFGGLPSGESFPRDPVVMQAWVRAGIIIKLGSTREFYQYRALYSACGWSMAQNGREGYNTCLEVQKDNADRYRFDIHGFKLSVHIGRCENLYSKTPSEWAHYDRHGDLSRYLGKVYALLVEQAEPGEMRAIRAKLRRVNPSELANRVRPNVIDWQAEADYWRNLELPPAATARANIAKVASGPFLPTTAIKFPEPLLQGNVDLKLTSLAPSRKLQDYPKRWDTVVLGYYSGNELRVIKQHKDERTASQDAYSDFENCMYVGEWEKGDKVESVGVAGGVSTSDFDEREQVALSREVVTTVKGEDLGMDSRPRLFIPGWSGLVGVAFGGITQHRYYSTETKETIAPSGKTIATGACVPYLMRDAVLYPHAKWQPGRVQVHHTKKWSWKRNPTSYDIVYRETGAAPATFTVTRVNYDPDGCSDFADQGSFFPDSGDVTRQCWDLINGPQAQFGFPITPFTVYMGGGSDPKVQTFDRREASEPEEPYIGDVEWEQRGAQRMASGVSVQVFFDPSPADGEDAASLNIPATRNHIGREYERVGFGNGGLKGYTRFHGTRSMPLLIGVVNE